MSERKVLNKYYPPDFDPSKIPRQKRPKNDQYKVRLMAPFNMRCLTCGVYIYKATKFNARKETVEDEKYLGIAIFRFYIRCPRCAQEISFKTDPENADYVAENGATRNFELWREVNDEEEAEKKKKEEEEEQNAMKALENRTKQSKREMDMLDALDQLRERSALHSKVDVQTLIHKNKELLENQLQLEQEEEDALVSQFFPQDGKDEEEDVESNVVVRRLEDSDEDSDGKKKKKRAKTTDSDLLADTSALKDLKKDTKSTLSGLVKPKAKPNAAVLGIVKKADVKALPDLRPSAPSGGGIGLIGDYGDSSSGNSDAD